jgi:beta-lactamase superfamily II metal-dependent hydrolase
MVVQTHPDFDHFHGMSAILDYFTTQGRQVDLYLDSGVGARVSKALLNDNYYAEEYSRLQEQLARLARGGKLVWRDLDADRPPLSAAGYVGRIEFIPIGPNATQRRIMVQNSLRRLADNSNAAVEANGLSIVLGLAIQDKDRECHVLLAADAEVAGLEEALRLWTESANDKGRSNSFDVVKVAHHGSIKNHCPRLCKLKRGGSRLHIAAISAGTRRVLPDKQVLADYLANEWQVLLTTTRTKQSQKFDRPMQLANRGAASPALFAVHDIHISWSAEAGLDFAPREALLKTTDIAAYETASRK